MSDGNPVQDAAEQAAGKPTEVSAPAQPSATDPKQEAAQRVTEAKEQAQERWNQATGAAAAASSDRPEIAVGAALAGGFVLAQIIKRLGS